MSQILSRLAPSPGTKRAQKRKGRGPGSGLGKTAGRGQKGQKARHPGNFSKEHFQGGQTPMQRRLPKIGFNVPFPIETIGINVGSLERFDAGAAVDEAALRKARLVQGREVRIKILGDGEITKKLTVTAHGFSKTATAKIEKAGGKCVVIPEPRAPKAEASAS